jgi:hypothetical protein
MAHLTVEPAQGKWESGNDHYNRATRTDDAVGPAQRAHIVLDVFEHVVRNETRVISWRGVENVEIVGMNRTSSANCS